MIAKKITNPIHSRSSGFNISGWWKIVLLVGSAFFAVAVLFYTFNAVETIQDVDLSSISNFGGPSNYAAYRRLLSNDSSPARCIDGSSPAYYFRKGRGGGENKWLVFFEGGGWCYDLKSCLIRSSTNLGSSRNYPEFLRHRELRHYVSGDLTVNPMLFNWNLAFVKYCDGGSFAGDATVRFEGHELHFKGKANREAVINALLTKEGMDQAEEVLLAGCSAGGLALFLGIDQMADAIHEVNPKTLVRGLADSGFFVDWTSNFKIDLDHRWRTRDDASVGGVMDYGNAMRNVYTFMNIAAGAHPSCVAHPPPLQQAPVATAAGATGVVSTAAGKKNPRRLQAAVGGASSKFAAKRSPATAAAKTAPLYQNAVSATTAKKLAPSHAAIKRAPAVAEPTASTGATSTAAATAKVSRWKSAPAAAAAASGSATAASKSAPALPSHKTSPVSKSAPAAKTIPSKAAPAATAAGAEATTTKDSKAASVANKQKHDVPAVFIGEKLQHLPSAACIFAAKLGPHIRTPMFMMQPKFDSWQIVHIYSKAYTPKGVNSFGARLQRQLTAAMFYERHPGHGLFLDACSHHCTGCSTPKENTWSGSVLKSDDGFNAASAFALWYSTSTAAALTAAGGEVASGHLRHLQSDVPSTAATAVGARGGRSGKNITVASNTGGHLSYLYDAGKTDHIFKQDKPYPCNECCSCTLLD